MLTGMLEMRTKNMWMLIETSYEKGDRIRIIRMDDSNGKDHQARQMNGRVVTVKFIDGIRQIHLKESGLALIPAVD